MTTGELWRSLDRAIMKYMAPLYELQLELAGGHRLRKALPHIVGPRVLEVSVGVGYLISQYAGQYETTGVDYNPRCVDLARKRLSRKGVAASLIEPDAHALPFPDASFNTVISTDAYSLYANPAQAMREALRVLAPGGRMQPQPVKGAKALSDITLHWSGAR